MLLSIWILTAKSMKHPVLLKTYLKTWSGTALVKLLDGAADGEALPAASKGALAEFKTCIILGSLRWEISTNIPKRFISLRTI